MHSTARLGRSVCTLNNASQVMKVPGIELCQHCSELGKTLRTFTTTSTPNSSSCKQSTMALTVTPQGRRCLRFQGPRAPLSHVQCSLPSYGRMIHLGSNFRYNGVFSKFCIDRQYHTSQCLSAGHNKWSKIKHRKAAADIERSKTFGRYTALIITAIRVGGPDPDVNLRLENAILRAKQAGVPKATIENAIRSATAKRSSSAENFLYDARGPSGYHLLIEVLSDNKRKTRPEIKNLLSKHGGLLGEPGSSSFVFEHKGVVRFPKSELSDDIDPLEIAIEVGAEDIIEDTSVDFDTNPNDSEGAENGGEKEEKEHQGKGQQEVGVVSEEEYIQLKCEPTELNTVSKAVKSKGFSLASSSLEYLPISYVSLDEDQYERAVRLVELLHEHDDVVEVYDNFILDSNSEAEE